MKGGAKKTGERYSYGEYVTWPDEERYEIIDGNVYNMTPAPSRLHQKISITLATRLNQFFESKNCEVYHAPFDVRLPEGDEKDEDIKTVVQPDLSVICDQSKLDEKGCKGAPDFIAEIVSPSTASRDYIKKLSLYEKHKVKEYWIIHPRDQSVMVYHLNENEEYEKPEIYAKEDEVAFTFFDFKINLNTIFTAKIEE